MALTETALDRPIAQYLQWQHSLGRVYGKEESVLASLGQFLVAKGVPELDQAYFSAWCHSHAGLSANVRRNRQRIVRNFCLYRQRTEPHCFVPDIHQFPRPIPYATPVIFGPAEVTKLLAATQNLSPVPNSPLRPAVMRLAIVLMYTTGLRRGELLRLTLADADAVNGVLRIRESKFHKSRWVPLSPDAQRELRAYLEQRLEAPFSVSSDTPLLVNCSRGFRGYTGTGLRAAIRSLFIAAEIRSADGRIPRVHDFRHSFAVQALLRWYRQGADVQSNLPKLALYMGHVSIVSTAYYLRWIPEVAAAASDRFEARFGHLITAGVS